MLRHRAPPPEPTPEQAARLARWQRRWRVPILAAAIVPLLTTPAPGKTTDFPGGTALALVVGLGSWLIFAVDLWKQRRIDPHYLRRRPGRVDVGIVVLTFPYYLLPGPGGPTGLLVLARLARVVRLLIATKPLRRFAARLGKVAVFALLIVLFGSLFAYGAEHKTNPGFADIGDALWWGIVTLTTVGYGDIVPETGGGRAAAIVIMFTGVAVLGILAGSLAQLFGLTTLTEEEGAPAARPPSVRDELIALQGEMAVLQERIGELAERAGET